MMKNNIEMDQTRKMNEVNAENMMNEKHMMSGQNSVCERIRVIENVGMKVIYSYNGNDRMSEMNRRYDVIDLTPVQEMREMKQMKYIYSLDEEVSLNRGDERLELYNLYDLHTSTDHMGPITVSRKVTHRRGKRLAKGQDESVCFSVPSRWLSDLRWQLLLPEHRSWSRAFAVNMCCNCRSN
ncbi:hypothetical protein [Paenibacillus sp. 1A_MP2]|uniref:hypothetical protein n=1 Tax=Paenibacillus sp. 1A_MP2 TaxID=3457495 RepID=UPI003FCD56E5